jgi:hypothetical protein
MSRFWPKSESLAGPDDYIQVPLDASSLTDPSQNPEICVTNVMGDEIKLVFSEPMDESQ